MSIRALKSALEGAPKGLSRFEKAMLQECILLQESLQVPESQCTQLDYILLAAIRNRCIRDIDKLENLLSFCRRELSKLPGSFSETENGRVTKI